MPLNLMTREQLRLFADRALAWFDERGLGTFGSLVEVADLLRLADLQRPERMTSDEYRTWSLLELRIVSVFTEAVLEHRSRCLRRQGDRLRVLQPEEQLDYGENDHSRAAMQKLRRGCRIVAHTETNDVSARNSAIDRLKDMERHVQRKLDERKHEAVWKS